MRITARYKCEAFRPRNMFFLICKLFRRGGWRALETLGKTASKQRVPSPVLPHRGLSWGRICKDVLRQGARPDLGWLHFVGPVLWHFHCFRCLLSGLRLVDLSITYSRDLVCGRKQKDGVRAEVQD